MTRRFLSFVDALRMRGIAVSPAEVLDALAGVTCLGVDRSILRETLAACMVKNPQQRPTFDVVFDQFFPLLLPRGRRRQKQHSSALGTTPSGRNRAKEQAIPRKLQRTSGARPVRQLLREFRKQQEPSQATTLREKYSCSKAAPGETLQLTSERLLQRRWSDLDPADVESLRPTLRTWAQLLRRRLARRKARALRGSLHFRATFRKAVSTAGVFVCPVFYRHRPRDTHLVALCDMSHSVAYASDFFLHLLAAARPFFRRARFFGFIDQPIELEVTDTRIQPQSAYDVYARSDLGHVLATLEPTLSRLVDRNTTLFILGDGRNNFRPPRAEILGALALRGRAVVWVQPEDPAQWGTADSAFLRYAQHCTYVLVARTPAELAARLSSSLVRHS